MAKTKKELADLAVRLFNNIDQADQFDNCGWIEKMFYHVDKACLIELIEDLRDAVQNNIHLGAVRFLFDSEEDLEDMLEEARKVLGEPNDDE